MRLADFILANTAPILGEWEVFARSVWPPGEVDPVTVRDHALEILLAAAMDMGSDQTSAQQSDKSRGSGGPAGGDASGMTGASDVHGAARVRSGFDMLSLVAEYRALRASVIRLWRESGPDPDLRDLDDLTRFNETIDESLAEAVRSYTEQVDRSRQLFLGILGHDLRNPLNAMTMSADLLLETTEQDPDGLAAVAQIKASAVAMGEMIGDLLDFTASGLGSAMPLTPAAADLGRVARAAVDEVRSARSGSSVRFRSAGDLTGDWDAARIRQLVSNLVSNAVQHGSGPDGVDVSVDADGPGVRLSVHNGGEPIPPDALPTIFDPLVRVATEATHRARRPGSIGLGLYVAREVAVAHGGTLDVRSTAADGTTFTVRLPRRPVGR